MPGWYDKTEAPSMKRRSSPRRKKRLPIPPVRSEVSKGDLARRASPEHAACRALGGYALLVGVPGLAKTSKLVTTLGEVLGPWRQLHPVRCLTWMPSDILGSRK